MKQCCVTSVAMTITFMLTCAALLGCANNGTTLGQSSSRQSTNPPSHAHLLTPESDEDLTSISDSELARRIADKHREIGRHMNAATDYMLDHLDRDLSADSEYQQLLRRAKQADTDLSVLEREVERRETQHGKTG